MNSFVVDCNLSFFSNLFLMEQSFVKRNMTLSFRYDAVTSEESGRLIKHYEANGYQAVRSLNVDPKYWDVVVTLPEQHYLKPTPRSMLNKMWG